MTKQEFINTAIAANYAGFQITRQDGRFYITSETGMKFGDGFGGTSFTEAEAPAGLIAEYERRLDLTVNAITNLL